MTSFVFNDSSLQKWPSRKKKKQENEEDEGPEEEKTIQNAHEKLLQRSWGKTLFH